MAQRITRTKKPSRKAPEKLTTRRASNQKEKGPQERLLLEKKPGPSLWVDPDLDPDRKPNRDTSTSGLVSPERDKIVEEHFREHPEGDPAVRRINPVRGTIAVERKIGPGIMRVFKKPTTKTKKRRVG